MTTKNNQSLGVNVGIDVGKAQLDICLYERDVYFTVENNPEGIRKALGRLGRYRLERIVIEATGRYEHTFVEAALDKGLPVIISNPLHIRRYLAPSVSLPKPMRSIAGSSLSMRP